MVEPAAPPQRSFLATAGFGIGVPALIYEVQQFLGHIDAPDFTIQTGWGLVVPHLLAAVVVGVFIYATAKLPDVKTGLKFFDGPAAEEDEGP